MQSHGVIEESDTPWSSLRLSGDEEEWRNPHLLELQEIERCHKKDCYPLPRHNDTLHNLAGAKWFSI